MKLYSCDEITILPSRQRQEFDDDALGELAEDIALQQLLHPIVVRETADGPILVSGERRMRAVRSLHEFAIPVRFDNRVVPLDKIPTVTLGELDDLSAREAEWSENFHRANLTWAEIAIAQAELHSLRTEQAKHNGTQLPTFTAIATEILGRPAEGSQVTKVAEAVRIVQHLHDPEVAAASSTKEAIKVIEKKLIREHHQELAIKMGAIAVSTRHKLHLGSALEAMALMLPATFDAIVSDPPYGVDAQDFGSQAQNQHSYDDSLETWQPLMAEVAERTFVLAKPQAHAYVFCAPQNFWLLADLMRRAGWVVWSTPLIWVKNTGMLPRPEHGPRRQYEFILFANKGDRKTLAIHSDVLVHPSEHTTLHPAQKPVSLIANLVSRSCRPGDHILDPFAGSGTIFPASNRNNCHAVGVEVNPSYYGQALLRLEEK